MVIAAPVSHWLDDLDPIVDPFHQICAQWPAHVDQNAGQVWFQAYI